MGKKNKITISIVLCVMCMLLTLGIGLQIRTIRRTGSTMSNNANENKLRDEVLRWKERYDNAKGDIERVERDLEKQRKLAAAGDEESKSIQEDLMKANKILGLTDVSGKGITITLDDNKEVSSQTTIDISRYIVHDTSIARIVNELKADGAEAISVNEQRIVPTTEILCVGAVVSINRRETGSAIYNKSYWFTRIFGECIKYARRICRIFKELWY